MCVHRFAVRLNRFYDGKYSVAVFNAVLWQFFLFNRGLTHFSASHMEADPVKIYRQSGLVSDYAAVWLHVVSTSRDWRSALNLMVTSKLRRRTNMSVSSSLPWLSILILIGKFIYRAADKSLARPGRKQVTATEDFWVSYILFIIIIGRILVLFKYSTRLASNEIF